MQNNYIWIAIFTFLAKRKIFNTPHTLGFIELIMSLVVFSNTFLAALNARNDKRVDEKARASISTFGTSTYNTPFTTPNSSISSPRKVRCLYDPHQYTF